MKTEQTKRAEYFLYNEYVALKMGVFGCFEVTFGERDIWKTGKRERVDFMTYSSVGEIRCYEIKVSQSDFNSSSAVSFHGHYNYYVLPKKLYESVSHKIHPSIGVILFDELDGRKRIARKSKRQNVTPGTVVNLLEAMMRSMHREQMKLYRIPKKGYWN